MPCLFEAVCKNALKHFLLTTIFYQFFVYRMLEKLFFVCSSTLSQTLYLFPSEFNRDSIWNRNNVLRKTSHFSLHIYMIKVKRQVMIYSKSVTEVEACKVYRNESVKLKNSDSQFFATSLPELFVYLMNALFILSMEFIYLEMQKDRKKSILFIYNLE